MLPVNYKPNTEKRDISLFPQFFDYTQHGSSKIFKSRSNLNNTLFLPQDTQLLNDMYAYLSQLLQSSVQRSLALKWTQQ